MRVFVAVEVPAVEVDGTLTGTQVQPAHITLEFLGEASPTQVTAVAQSLAHVAAETAPIEVEIEGVGAFPSLQRPRVAWVGVGRGSERLVDLARRVGASLAPLGFPAESRSFVPHVTLFRVRSPADARRAHALLSRPPVGPLASGVVLELLLKESLLSRSGAVHRVVASSPLAGRSD